ncbi:hypothetical protein GCM10020331_097560 [Ectobacillus funiculus]
MAGLNIANIGFTFTNCPFTRSNPCGAFMNALTTVIKIAEKDAPIATGINSNRCFF